VQFDSFHFLIFFSVVAAVFWSIPDRARWVLLLAASYYFYMCWEAPYALLLLASTIIDYSVGLLLGRVSDPKIRRRLIVPSLAANLGFLFYFKYYDFAARTMNQIAGSTLLAPMPFLLPAGISFYTFQTLSYTLDVYWKEQKPEHHFGRFATFVAFFPHLVAGPIMRAGTLIPQLRTFPPFEYGRVSDGLKLVGWGLFKKCVIADRLAHLVDPVYAYPAGHSGFVLGLATVAFGYQIYCDFSGYSDIAIGISQVLGVNLVQNFRAPYHSRSLREFWTRWHISLSTWFRDYVYIPLGGKRVSAGRWCLNILIVFGLSGMWHGANWTFAIWGIYHGVLLIVGRFSTRFWSALYGAIGLARSGPVASIIDVVFTFLVVTIGWVFFRSANLTEGVAVLRTIATDWASYLTIDREILRLLRTYWSPADGAIILVALAILEIGDSLQDRFRFRSWLAKRPAPARWAAYYALACMLLFWGQFNGTPFIYFQF
jgi:D-alanyl-lipoteichoic acid acyltransferase DltB (MBOAT superfamily)